jgi:hypothetical protein
MICLNRSKMKSFLQSLNAEEKAQVLKTLLDDNPELMKKAYDIAVKIVSDVDAETIMHEVYCELNSLDVYELYDHSGKTRYGYVDIHDLAWEMFEGALSPLIDEMKSNQQRALPAAAKFYCTGIIKGLWKFEEESNSDFKDWVTDAAGDYISTVLAEWKKGKPSDDEVDEVMGIVKEGLS